MATVQLPFFGRHLSKSTTFSPAAETATAGALAAASTAGETAATAAEAVVAVATWGRPEALSLIHI